MKKITSTLFLMAIAHVVMAQFPAVTIPGTEVRKITSAIVAGQEYELQIMLPGGYRNANKKYPVVYLMDSQWDFPLLKSIYGQQYYDGFIPEMIIVGVTWGGVAPNADSLRARDYTPTKEQRLPQSGGADQFLDFMKQELFPFIESNYKADNNNRSLAGCSLGGLFTIYTMFTHTEMFTGYAAASPAVGWDKEVLYQYEKTFAKRNIQKPIRLYLTVGDVEPGRSSFERFSNFIKEKKYGGVSIRSKILENTGHSGTKSETYNRGLQYIFEKPDLQLSDEALSKFTGTYEMGYGIVSEVKLEDHQLVLYAPGINKLQLKAASASRFYTNSFFLNIEFADDGKTALVNQYGSTVTVHKK